jgi:hypothetical protein
VLRVARGDGERCEFVFVFIILDRIPSFVWHCGVKYGVGDL